MKKEPRHPSRHCPHQGRHFERREKSPEPMQLVEESFAAGRGTTIRHPLCHSLVRSGCYSPHPRHFEHSEKSPEHLQEAQLLGSTTTPQEIPPSTRNDGLDWWLCYAPCERQRSIYQNI